MVAYHRFHLNGLIHSNVMQLPEGCYQITFNVDDPAQPNPNHPDSSITRPSDSLADDPEAAKQVADEVAQRLSEHLCVQATCTEWLEALVEHTPLKESRLPSTQ